MTRSTGRHHGARLGAAETATDDQTQVVVVMGVAGVGKST